MSKEIKSKTKLQQKQLAFLEETVKFYNTNNRCVEGSKCFYYLDGKDGCAIGRHIKNKTLCRSFDKYSLTSVITDSIFYSLPKKLQYLTQMFLDAIQKLHDNKQNWNKGGLSERGKGEVKIIKTEFSLN